MRYPKFAACFCALALLCASSARAVVLVDYKPVPASPVMPEFMFAGPGTPSLQSGPGAYGNSDGNLPISGQTAGGLEAESPFIIPGVPGGYLNITPGSTTFYDTTLILNGLSASGPAITAAGTLIQPLGSGGFDLYSTDLDGPGGVAPILLLSGTINNAKIVGEDGGEAGAVFSASGVTYTGGLIYAALLADGGNPNLGSISISMIDVTPNFGIDPSSGFLNPFSANATGLYSYVPEPASCSLIALAGIAIARRRRKLD